MGSTSFFRHFKFLQSHTGSTLLSLSFSKRRIVTTGKDQNLPGLLPVLDDIDADIAPRRLKIGVQGAGFDRGQRKPGVEKGPDVVRGSGFIDFLKNEVGHSVIDYGNLHFDLGEKTIIGPANLRNLSEVAKATQLISHCTSKIIKDGRICLTIGGDHSIAIGTINGVTEALGGDVGVLWIDAHCDINTPATTTSGNLHGMTLAFLLQELKSYVSHLPEFSWVVPRIRAKNIAYIGLRSVDPGERALLDQLGITAYSMRDVDRFGIIEVTQKALKKISAGFRRPCHVSFDIDSLDDNEVSNTGTPVAGGLTLREGMTLLEEIYDSGANVVSMDLVEVNSALGDSLAEKRTATLAKHLLGSAFGYSRGGTLTPTNEF